jgi:serine/threonine protein kinase
MEIPPPPKAESRAHRSAANRESMIGSDGRPAWASLEIFRGMDDDVVDELRVAMQPVLFAPGEAILQQGQTGDDMFLLDQGSVRVSVRGNMADTSFERVLTAPAMFGEMALITNEGRTANVTAESSARCLRLDREAFSALVQRNPRASTFMTRVVGERLLEAGSIKNVGKYEVFGRLGAGAVATVFEAMNPKLGRPVALKMLSHALVYHPGFAEQFHREAQLVAQLDHDHIVRVYDTEQAYGTHFIVMEKLTGMLLEDLVESETVLPWGAVRRILREALGALAYSHDKGLMHRDIKPSNIFLTEDRRVKILDFGIAVSQEASASKGGHLLGTPYYMAPEQILGRQLDGRADLYSLGIVAYELIAKRVPFDADTLDELLRLHLHTPLPDPRQVVPDLPDDLLQFIRKATAKRPADRFGSCAEAAQFLQTAAELPMVHKIELSTLAISYHPSRRRVVAQALRDLHQTLGSLAGVSLLYGHQASRDVDEES